MRLLFRVPFFTLGLINFEYFISNILLTVIVKSQSLSI